MQGTTVRILPLFLLALVLVLPDHPLPPPPPPRSEYKVRPTRTQILKNPKLRPALTEAAPPRTEDMPKCVPPPTSPPPLPHLG